MNGKNQILGGIVGGLIGSIITALLVSSGTAQRDKFDTIQCHSLEVVDADGKVGVAIGINEHGGAVDVYGENPKSKVLIGVDEQEGHVKVLGINEFAGAINASSIECTTLRVVDKDGKTRVVLSFTPVVGYGDDNILVSIYGDHVGGGGAVRINDMDGKERVSAGCFGGGFVYVVGRDRKSSAGLDSGEHGGRVYVGKGEKVLAGMGINEYGNGWVSTWDKNGYRQ